MSVREQLDVLEVSGLVRLAKAQPDLAYLFRHALVQEAAYNSLLKQQRRVLHLSVGEALERAAGERATEIAAVLARHFDEGEDFGRALQYYVSAGDAASRKFATMESLTHYERAIQLAQLLEADRALVVRLWLARGRALEMTGRYVEADATYVNMEKDASKRGDAPTELAAAMARATIHSAPTALFNSIVGQELSERALALARSLGDRASEAKINWNLLLVSRFSGHFEQAIVYGRRSATLAREFGLREQLAYTLNDRYQTLIILKRFEEGQSVSEEARTLWKELGNLPLLADSLSNAAEVYWIRGQSRRAVVLADEALTISQSIGNLWGQSYGRLVAGFARMELGELGEGILLLQEAAQLGAMSGFVIAEIVGRVMPAMMLMQLGALSRAEKLAQEALAVVAARLPVFGAAPLLVLAGVQRRRGQLSESEATLQRARDNMSDMDKISNPMFSWEAFESALAFGEAQHVLESAGKQLAEALASQTLSMVPVTRYYQACAMRQLGQNDEAHSSLVQAFLEAKAAESRRSLLPILEALIELEMERGSESEAHRWRGELREVIDYALAHTRDPELRELLIGRQPKISSAVSPVEG
jgi:tetratricopeptide (TPR) repeat protein